MKMREIINLLEDAYRGEHGAPEKDNGAPLFNLCVLYPADIYGPSGRSYTDGGIDLQSLNIASACKGHPNKIITVFRAVPKDLVRPKIMPGDWVTINRAYAVEHGRDNLLNNFKIIKKTVFARDLYTEGNSLSEWGYDPQPFVNRADEDQIRLSLGMKTVADARAAAQARRAPIAVK